MTADPLLEFLSARLDETAAAILPGPEPDSWCDRADGVHVDAKRAHADAAAKRQIIEMHGPIPVGRYAYCASCGELAMVDFPCATLRALAAVHADHPDYRPEWAL